MRVENLRIPTSYANSHDKFAIFLPPYKKPDTHSNIGLHIWVSHKRFKTFRAGFSSPRLRNFAFQNKRRLQTFCPRGTFSKNNIHVRIYIWHRDTVRRHRFCNVLVVFSLSIFIKFFWFFYTQRTQPSKKLPFLKPETQHFYTHKRTTPPNQPSKPHARINTPQHAQNRYSHYLFLSFSLLTVDGRNKGWLYFVKAQTSVTCDGDGVVNWVPAAVQNFLVEAHFGRTGGASRAEGGLLQGACYVHYR